MTEAGDRSGEIAIPWLSANDAEVIVSGHLRDPFAVLGPHHRGTSGRLVALDPHAETLTARGAADWPLAPVPDCPGLFAGEIPAEASHTYRLHATGDGRTWDYDDPFRFGPVLGEIDEHLLGEGTHQRLWRALGAHVMTHEGVPGTHFAVWAPNAVRVSVVGDFNAWDARRAPMRQRGASGVWEIFLPGIGAGEAYKYALLGPHGVPLPLKADPVGFGSEHPPGTASIVRDLSGYGWKDAAWMAGRAERNARTAPIAIYEVHLGSWRRRAAEGNRPLSYRELAEELVAYATGLGFTHLELMPVSEYPFDGSWGYQPVGMFAPTIRHGPPHEFRDLVDAAHRAGLGVILDWVPGHFPADAHGLRQFDGTALYEYADAREGYHPDWNTLIYNYGRREVANYLTANACYWLEEYHADGLRMDAVASMLYRDYSRAEGEWIPNIHGGRENLEAIELLRRVNATVYGAAPGILTAAEESTSFPGVSHPVDAGGLGFGYKWNMGWMNDALTYMMTDPIHRRWHHSRLTFGLLYAFSENFILPISHDEVVHGKGSMLTRMPGSDPEKFASLRAFYGFMWGHPGKKLLFMGQEFAQRAEWNHDAELDWDAATRPEHAGIARLVRDLNTLYRTETALHVNDAVPEGFTWLDVDSADLSVFAWVRFGAPKDPPVAVVVNFTPVERSAWCLGLPRPGRWREALNTDAGLYGGNDRGNLGFVIADGAGHKGQPHSVRMTLPPLSAVFLVHDPENSPP